ncbi:hypothetical protein [Nannocystis radixulma]|uniref:Outer membrane protein beta-barrel domain-containing protein n=1 Tax=Nannocystis radixulma TaxID=2995305 RepID=A0ABT5B0V7_9BACT|nr:hypothetical protein [Nannocystis radixulma]MDC0667722.1 hypothetical protein [Nannocystis radixulma]
MSDAFTLLLSGWLAAVQVPEPPPTDDIQWLAPAGCGSRDALLARIAERRGRPLEPGQARLVARATGSGPRRHRLELEFDVAGRHDARVLVARSCAALVDAAALVVTLAVDGSSGEAPVPPSEPLDEPPPEPEPEPESVVPPVVPPEPALEAVPEPPATAEPLAPPPPPPRPRRRPGGFLRLQGLGEFGALPGPTGGVGLAGGLLWRWFRLELHASYLAPRTDRAFDTDIRVSLVAAGALGCVRLGRRALEFPICLGLEAGGLPGAADGPGGRNSSVGRWLAATGSVGAAVRVHPRVAVWAALHGLAAIQRGSFVLRTGHQDFSLHDPSIGSGRLALGVEVRFGDPR